jgi:FkbM family methyltransferase
MNLHRAAGSLRALLPRELRRRWLKPSNFWTWDLDGMSGELPDFRVSLRRIRKSGYSPSLIVDIGAYNGDWSRMAQEIWPSSSLVLIEALEHRCRRLSARFAGIERVRVVNGVLSGREGEVREFQEMETGSSLYPELSDHSRQVRQVRTSTLDRVLERDAREHSAVLVKMDVQGAELEILQGAPNTLAATQWIALEASLIPMNSGAPVFEEVVASCRKLGFVVADFAGFHRDPRTTQLRQVDVIFRRDA